MMYDFWGELKPVLGCLFTFFVVLTGICLFGRAGVYLDQYKAGLMQNCQSNGYTWGDCYNVIHGNQDSFTK